MKLRTVRVRNFRCYSDAVSIEFDSLTALIGRNDAGKSSIFDALAIFFGELKPDGSDASNAGDKSDMAITCEYDDIPSSIVIDATSPTNLKEEYLLNSDGPLESVSRTSRDVHQRPDLLAGQSGVSANVR